jgi:hypothetical protein
MRKNIKELMQKRWVRGLIALIIPAFDYEKYHHISGIKKSLQERRQSRNIYQFSIRTISQFLQKSGFKIANIRYYSVGTLLSSIENLTKGRILCSHNPALRLFSLGMDIFLDILGWGDCIEIHAFKIVNF